MHTARDAERVIRTYGDLLYRVCFLALGNERDVEDVIQDTVVRYLEKAPQFNGPEHEKAWLLRVAVNRCHDVGRFRARHPQISQEQLEQQVQDPEDRSILEALMTLPKKFRVVMTLYYVEEYPIDDIAKLIGRTPSAVKMRLQKGRRLLADLYRKEYL